MEVVQERVSFSVEEMVDSAGEHLRKANIQPASPDIRVPVHAPKSSG
jgi:hypothetical protein